MPYAGRVGDALVRACEKATERLCSRWCPRWCNDDEPGTPGKRKERLAAKRMPFHHRYVERKLAGLCAEDG